MSLYTLLCKILVCKHCADQQQQQTKYGSLKSDASNKKGQTKGRDVKKIIEKNKINVRKEK